MSLIKKSIVAFFLFSLFIPFFAKAEDDGGKLVPTEVWAKFMNEEMIKYVCQDKGQWLTCFDFKPENCAQIATPFIKGCIEKTVKDAPKQINKQQGGELGGKVGGCFLDDFIAKNGQLLKKTEECAKPPKHLR